MSEFCKLPKRRTKTPIPPETRLIERLDKLECTELMTRLARLERAQRRRLRLEDSRLVWRLVLRLGWLAVGAWELWRKGRG